jgi:hypothetical protein
VASTILFADVPLVSEAVVVELELHRVLVGGGKHIFTLLI